MGKYKLEHKCPELDDDQIFIILFEYYVELIVSGKINLKRNNEDNINDLAAVARAIKEEQRLTFSVFIITLILCACHIYGANQCCDLEAIAKALFAVAHTVTLLLRDFSETATNSLKQRTYAKSRTHRAPNSTSRSQNQIRDFVR